MPTPIELLIAYSKKLATKDAVMRALVEHDDWHLPALYLPGEHKVAENLVIYSADFSLREDTLLVFTDRRVLDSVVDTIGRRALGIYAGGVKGTALFGGLDAPALAKVKELHVNPGLPQEQRWFVHRDGFAICRLWASAVALERKLNDLTPELFTAMHAYEFLVPLAKSDQTLVQVPVDGQGNYVFLFTAIDHYERFLAKLGDRASQVTQVMMPGAKLFPFLQRSGIDGFYLNSAMPFPRSTFEFLADPVP